MDGVVFTSGQNLLYGSSVFFPPKFASKQTNIPVHPHATSRCKIDIDHIFSFLFSESGKYLINDPLIQL